MPLSLRSFHLFFVAVSVLLSAWVGAWAIAAWRDSGAGAELAMGVLFFVLGAVLVVYFARVRRKLRAIAPEEE